MPALSLPRWPAKNRSLIGILAWLCLGLSSGVQAGALERALMPGPVSQAHHKYEAECERCHASFDREAQPRLCLACHEETAGDIQAKRGLHGRQPAQPCAACHGEHLGLGGAISRLDEAHFDHALTDFALAGKHAAAQCSDCHTAGTKRRETPGSCKACHRDDDRHAGRLGERCGDCHNASDWTQVDDFDHSRTEFRLAGAHAKVECTGCHRESKVEPRLPQDCQGCHRDDDPHRGAMGADCAQCHVDSDWKTARYDHAQTGWPLLGAHRDAACAQCHPRSGEYRGASQTCSSCHRDDDRHRGNLGTRCEDCHDSGDWRRAVRFDHARSEFPLLGKHVGAACSGCHADAAHYRGTGQACVDCHREDDSHHGRNGSGCADCHDASDWKHSLFDHNRATDFALRGAHAKAKCEGCHSKPVAEFTPPSVCVECHRKDDVHKTRLGDTCVDCHDEQAWKPSRYQHDRGRFPLIGGHRALECGQCHRTQLYADTQADCASCHAEDDAHDGRYGNDCASCHNARAWALWDYDHTLTRFALDGAHRKARCASCHTPQRGARLSGDCAGCHSEDDAHDGGFGRQCARCHTTTSFTEVNPRVPGKSP
jgi:hypothetical protein